MDDTDPAIPMDKTNGVIFSVSLFFSLLEGLKYGVFSI